MDKNTTDDKTNKNVSDNQARTFSDEEYHQYMLAVDIAAATSMLMLDAEFRKAIFPFGGLDGGIPSSARKYASDALRHAAALGDQKQCKDLYIDFDADINSRDKRGNTALLNAVRHDKLDVAKWLMRHGAQILPNKGGDNPVLWACATGCIPALNMFNYYGVDFNQGYTHWSRSGKFKLPEKMVIYPLTMACIEHKPRAVQWLIDHGASIDVPVYKKARVRDLVNSPDIDAETKSILAKKAAETTKTVKPVPFWKRISGRG